MQSRTLLTLSFVVSMTVLLAANTRIQQEDGSDVHADVVALLKERRDVLAERVALFKNMVDQGVGGHELLIGAHNQLLEAELQLVSTKDERVALYKKRVENFLALEDRVSRLHAAGSDVSRDSVLSAKAARLQGQIDLLREQL